MKRLFALFFAAVTLLTFSCKKDDDTVTSSSKSGSSDTVEVKVEDTVIDLHLSRTTGYAGDTLTLTGLSLKESSTPVVFFNETKANVFKAAEDTFKVVIPETTSGEIKVTVDEGTVAFDFQFWEFSCELFDQLEVTEFKFTKILSDEVHYSVTVKNNSDSYVGAYRESRIGLYYDGMIFQNYDASVEGGPYGGAGGSILGYYVVFPPHEEKTVTYRSYTDQDYLKVNFYAVNEGAECPMEKILFEGKIPR